MKEKSDKRKNYLEKVSLPVVRNFRNVFLIGGLVLAVDAFQSLFIGDEIFLRATMEGGGYWINTSDKNIQIINQSQQSL